MKLSKSFKIVLTLGLIIFATDVISSLLFMLGHFVGDDPTKFLPRWIGLAGLAAWILTYGYFISIWYRDLVWLLSENIKGRYLLTTIVLALFLGIILFRISDPTAYSGETPQEVGCTLRWMSLSSDLGFRDTCLFEYPLRQFYLQVIPTLIFGRSQFALNLGGSLWLILGLSTFVVGALRFYRSSNSKFDLWTDALCALHIAIVFHIYFINHFSLQYEQSIFPISMTFLAVGFTFRYLTDSEPIWLLALALSGLHAIYSYTPGIAMVGLLLAGLLTVSKEVMSNPKHRRCCHLLAALLLIELLCSFTIRGDVRILGNDTSTEFLLDSLEKGGQHLLFQNQGMEYVSRFFNPYFMLVILVGLSLQLGWRFALASLWVIACLVSALIMKGYTYYGIDFRLHKAMVIFPVLLAMSMQTLSVMVGEKKKFQWILVTLLVPVLALGLNFQEKYLQTIHPSRILAFTLWVQKKIPLEPTRLFFSHELQDPYFTFGDAKQYYLPLVESFFIDDKCSAETFSNADNPRKMYVALPAESGVEGCPALQLFAPEKIGTFSFKDDKDLALYRITR